MRGDTRDRNEKLRLKALDRWVWAKNETEKEQAWKEFCSLRDETEQLKGDSDDRRQM